MKRVIAILVCASISMIISAILKSMLHFSDYTMVALDFIMFFTLFMVSKKKDWI